MGQEQPVSVWFVCKSCGSAAYQSMAEFIQHKMETHFSEFQNVRCIIFGEIEGAEANYLTSNSSTKYNLQLGSPTQNEEQSELVQLHPKASSSNLTSINTENKHENTDKSCHPSCHKISILPEEIINQIDMKPDLPLIANIIDTRSSNANNDIQESPPLFIKCEPEERNVSDDSISSLQPSQNDQKPDSHLEPKTEWVLYDDSSSTENSHALLENVSGDFTIEPYGSNEAQFVFPTHGIGGSTNTGEGLNIPQYNTLKDWLKYEESQKTDSNVNVIVLDPDPRAMDVKPITPDNPIQCKLCCEKLYSELGAIGHVKNCWLFNKKCHRYCVHCNKTYGKPILLKRHTKYVHATQEKKAQRFRFQCHLCPKVFNDKRNLIHHTETHQSKDEQPRPFVCTVCGNNFRRPYSLAYHMKSHSESRPYTCSYPNCSYAFKVKAGLRAHLNKKHSQEISHEYSQPDCGKTFKHNIQPFNKQSM